MHGGHADTTQAPIWLPLFGLERFRKGLNNGARIARPCNPWPGVVPEALKGEHMEEPLCNVEFLKSNSTYVARVQSDLGGLREYRSGSLEEILEQVIIDLQEEFEAARL